VHVEPQEPEAIRVRSIDPLDGGHRAEETRVSDRRDVAVQEVVRSAVRVSALAGPICPRGTPPLLPILETEHDKPTPPAGDLPAESGGYVRGSGYSAAYAPRPQRQLDR